MICDPGPRSFELISPSTFYVALTRGTTLGDATRLNSAIYFCEENITPQRLKNMTIRITDHKPTLKCQRRRKWIRHLDRNMHGSTVTKKKQKKTKNSVKQADTHKKNYTKIFLCNRKING